MSEGSKLPRVSRIKKKWLPSEPARRTLEVFKTLGLKEIRKNLEKSYSPEKPPETVSVETERNIPFGEIDLSLLATNTRGKSNELEQHDNLSAHEGNSLLSYQSELFNPIEENLKKKDMATAQEERSSMKSVDITNEIDRLRELLGNGREAIGANAGARSKIKRNRNCGQENRNE